MRDRGPAGRLLPLKDGSIHLVERGPADGPPALLLHGFPESHYGWRHQMEPLAASGRRVLVPDQRGYHHSHKPAGVHHYQLTALADEAAELLLALRAAPALVVGHDWGGAVAWWLALVRPELVERLLIINAPHPQAFRSKLWSSGQWLRIWYIALFQLPRLPELSLRSRNWRGLWSGMVGSAPAGLFKHSDFERYRRAWGQPGALTAMLNWYRALLRFPPPPLADWTVTPPTTIIWGEDDRFLAPSLAAASLAYCSQGELHQLPGVNHWVHHERPQFVLQAMLG